MQTPRCRMNPNAPDARPASMLNLGGLSLGGMCVVGVMLLGACTSEPTSRVHVITQGSPQQIATLAPTQGSKPAKLRLATLGFGDALGRQLRSNDAYLAYLAERDAQVRVTNVPELP